MRKGSGWRVFAAVIAGASACAAAAADSYRIDPDHTYPSLEFTHMGISTWRGKFTKTSGRVTLDRAARTGRAEIQVDTESIDFGHRSMNQFAISAEWLNVDQFPKMTYSGTLEFQGDTPASVDGKLTLLGVTRPLKLRINSFKCIRHPLFRREVCGADVEGVLNRADFGMTQYSDGEAGKVQVRIQVEAFKED